MGEIQIATRYGPLSTYLATPTVEGPWPGVVVVHDAIGMSRDLRRQADWLANEGYLAAAPDLYFGGGTMLGLLRVSRHALTRKGRTFDALDAVRLWLSERDGCTGKIGVIGFCMGGGVALLAAATGRFSAASVNYGSVPKDADRLLANSCPIVGSYGAQDRTLKSDPSRLERVLTAHGIDHDVKVYPDAGHAFINDPDPAQVPLIFKLMQRFMATGGYHRPSADDAKGRISAFFAKHLK